VVLHFASPQPSLHAAFDLEDHCHQNLVRSCERSLQIFCGNGLTREYPIEKILARCARSACRGTGCNEILAIQGGTTS